jgi:putative hemolysin
MEIHGAETKTPMRYGGAAALVMVLLLLLAGSLGVSGDAVPSQDALALTAPAADPCESGYGLPNPADVYCGEMGYRLEVVDEVGGERSNCVFPDGSVCDTWQFYAGTCGEAYSYCARLGYQQITKTNGADPFSPQYAVCVREGVEIGSVSDLLGLSQRYNKAIPLAEEQPGPQPEAGTLSGITAVPVTFDWRNHDGEDWMTDVQNQARCGSCWAFSAVGTTEAAYNIAQNEPDLDLDLSEEFLNSNCPTPNPGSCCGGFHWRALDIIRDDGIPDEDCMPWAAGYYSGSPSCGCFGLGGVCEAACTGLPESCSRLKCGQQCANWDERLVTIDGYTAVGSNVADIQQALVDHGPIAVCLAMSGSFDADGIYRCTDCWDLNHNGTCETAGVCDLGTNKCTSGLTGWDCDSDWDCREDKNQDGVCEQEHDCFTNHCVIIAGYDDTDDHWIVKNSWGSGWHGDGYWNVGFNECHIESQPYWVDPAEFYFDSPAEPIVQEAHGSFVYGGGLLYWQTDCANEAEPSPVYIRRQPETGGAIQTLYEVGSPTVAQCSAVSQYNVADDDGFFYFNAAEDRLDARLIYDPETVIPLITGLGMAQPILATDDDYVYVTRSGGIYRSAKDSLGSTKINLGTGVTSLVVDETYVYWLDATGLWRSLKTCTSPSCWGIKELLATPGGKHLTWTDEGDLLWVNHSSGNWWIFEEQASGFGSTVYWSPDEVTWNIGRPVYHDGCYFWLEDQEHGLIPPRNSVLRKKCGSGGAITIAVGLTARDMLAVSPLGVVFSDVVDDTIYRVDFDAEAITRDFHLEAMEVTQGIQNLYNTVDLVAEKTTYVRVFGSLDVPQPVGPVQVALHGYRDDAELPGSPLYPVHRPPSVSFGDMDRGDPDGAWVFQLPQSWTQEGWLSLMAQIDPQGVYSDPDWDDNYLVSGVTFQRKAPICYVFVPVRSEAGRGSADNPTFAPMVDLAEQLLPVPEMRVYFHTSPVEELQVCWKWGFIPYPCFGPYELWQDSLWGDWASDRTKVVTSLAARYTVSDLNDGLQCDGGRVQFVGMVHEDSYTEGVIGLGRYDSHASWVKLSQPSGTRPDEYPWTWPRSGSVLVHESGHNIERYHVDCGDPDDIDDDYPYTDGNGKACILDDGDLGDYGTHFGFDINSLQPIRPDIVGLSDLMSYASYVWVSDYTWEAFFDELPAGSSTVQSTNSQPVSLAAPEQVDLAAGDAVVLIGGLVSPSLNEGRLNYAWVFPTDSVSSQVLGKLQAIASPAGGESPSVPVSQYLLRLRDANGAVVADHVFMPELAADDPSPDELAGFLLSFPAPDVPVAQIDLLIWGVAVDSLDPGASMPTVEILQPAGGETFDDQMTIVWQAADADVDDRLLFTVQYSPNLGQTWGTMVTDWPGPVDSDTVTLTLDSLLELPASTTGGLVRVLASDGYNTAMATSDPFVVLNQAPQPYIISPATDQLFEAGEAVLLRGGAYDTEDGSLSGASLSWGVTGQAIVTGEEVFLVGLAPGGYDVTLTAQDSDGGAETAQAALTVSPLGVPGKPANVALPELDGFCNDEVYSRGVVVGLKPYPDGNQAMASLVRSDDHLWVCFTGLNRGSASMMDRPMNSAGLLIDADYSHEHALQAGDKWIYVQEDGTPTVWAGPAWGGDPTPNGLKARVSANDNAWNAELRIDASLLGGWNHLAGLELLHVWVPESGGSHYGWPYAANNAYPDSWATTVLGKWPRLDSLTPNDAVESNGTMVIGVSGHDFVSGAVALWNGEPRTTVFLGSTDLLLTTNAGDLAGAGTAQVRVQNPGLGAAPSNALTFFTKNPVPEITELTPDEITAGYGDLLIGVTGQDFDDGAVALWNGEPKYTVVNNSTFLRFRVDAADLATVHDVGVAVRNPEPGGGASNIITFTLLAPSNQAPDAPFAPEPADGATDVPTDQILTWQGSDPEGQPLRYNVAFGTSKPPVVASGLTVASYDPGGLEPDTLYYWRITASDGLIETTGTLWSFRTATEAAPNRPPRVPSRPNPSDGLTNVPVDQVLSWAGGDPDGDPVRYSVALGTYSPPPIVDPDVTRSTYTPPAPLAAGRTYYWRIVASDGRETTTGPIWSFTTLPSNRAPYVPSRPIPPHGELDVSLDPVLTWAGGDPDGDAVTYSVYLGTGLPLPLVATGLTDSRYEPATLEPGTPYYWGIAASDGVSSTRGPVWSFTTIPPNEPPYAPYKPDPADRETGVPTDQVLTWHASDPERDRLTYDVYFGTSSTPPLVAEGLTTPSYDPPSLRADTIYYWIVAVSDGAHETVGPTWKFRTAVPNRAPYEPYAPSPADRASGVPVAQVLTWRCYDPDRDTLTYDVYFGTMYPPLLVSRGLTTTVYSPSTLSQGMNYYWGIRASDGINTTVGPTWRFQTAGNSHVYLPLVVRNQ